ncbi:hypothetical protein GCM10009069_01240 [Algimonas arctica]|uniref:Uncharacterized protein n=1 Tax=Algimonas arctica TaxID=1479486 RepID=A0A8J3CJZ9_9PROT|nr:hypothetical protein [Algimonas arctica]GHA81913.1 hypothetical protein GCM10009069_01240 [Algimonas arctica]
MPKLRLPLLLTRLSIFYFLLPWQLMRFMSPGAADGIAKKYYHMPGLNETVGYAIGAFWIILLIAFLLGFKKRISYGLVFLLHTGAIFVVLPAYIMGTDNFNQLFLAAIPAAAAMGLLYALRDQDTLLSLK